MPTVQIPPQLRKFTDFKGNIPIHSGHLINIITTLISNYPSLRSYLINDDNSLSRFVNIYLNGEDIRQLDKLSTECHDNDILSIVLAVAGG